MREIGLVYGRAFLRELLNHCGHIYGIPNNDGVRHQIETTRLMRQDLTTGMTELALIRHDQERSQVVQRLAVVPENPCPLKSLTYSPLTRILDRHVLAAPGPRSR
jgi:hypothetical protein